MNLDGCWDNVNLPQNDDQYNPDKDVIEEENGVKTFRVKNYIPKRSSKKYLNFPYITGATVIFILIIIIIILANLKNKSILYDCPTVTTTEEVILDVSAEITLLNKNQFFVYDTHKASLKLLLEVKNHVQSFIISPRQTLFWIEANSSNILSLQQPGSETEKDINLIFDETRLKPLAIALDSINNNLYSVDESIGGFVVINLNTKYHAIILMDIISPRYIEVDAVKGLMFIGSTEKIHRAHLDGNNVSTVVDATYITAIALDPTRERLFWVNSKETIMTCDYSGKIVTHLLADTALILDLTILDGYLFWLRKPSENQTATLWSCKIQNTTCDDHNMLPDAISTSTLLRTADRTQRHDSMKQNRLNQQKCEHLSLATPSGQMTCVCNMSSQLIFNKKCEPVTQFVLYTLNNFTRSSTVDMSQKIRSEPFWPTSYRISNLTFKTEIDFDYDFENDDFYFSEDMVMYKMKLRGKNPQQEVVLVSDNGLYIEDLAYDWLTGNMYYSLRSKLSSGKHILAVWNVKKAPHFRKILKHFTYDSSFGMKASAYGLAVYPSRGSLFFTAGENGHRYIFQTTMNGTVITKFTNVLYVHDYRLIAVDYDRDRLYWISSSNTVTHAHFDGTDRRQITTRLATTISIKGQWMYLSDLQSVWRVNKETGLNMSYISPTINASQRVSGARIISQPPVIGNPCRERNNSCQQFCFYGKKAICDCDDNFRVTPEGTCI